MLKTSFFYVALFFCMFPTYGQDSYSAFGDEESLNQFYLGVSLRPSANGAIMHFGLIRIYPDGTRKVRLISKDSFMNQLIGNEKSEANPKKENLFTKNQIQNYTIIDELWRLRYGVYPYESERKLTGWAESAYKPSAYQLKMLNQYGLKSINDFVYGDNLFKLLKDMSDPAWIQKYKGE